MNDEYQAFSLSQSMIVPRTVVGSEIDVRYFSARSTIQPSPRSLSGPSQSNIILEEELTHYVTVVCQLIPKLLINDDYHISFSSVIYFATH